MAGSRLAIIGGGIAGLGCAHFLHREFDITLFERGSYPGGHVNTLDVAEGDRTVSVDSGFMVYNRTTYPQFCRLLDGLSVKVKPTDMSFSVSHVPRGLEWSGTGFARFFARRSNFFSADFWRLLFAINRFNKEARVLVNSSPGDYESMSTEEFVKGRGLGTEVLDHYLLPMMSSLWSAPADTMLKFPIVLLVRFMHTHGLLSVYDKLDWFTIDGGARNYVSELVRPFLDRIKLSCGVKRLEKVDSGLKVCLDDGESQVFDKCIFACHADQAAAILSPSHFPEERDILSGFSYQKNVATLHCDSSVMPRCRGNWASWNYKIVPHAKSGQLVSTTHYWMNSLQGVSENRDYFITIDSADSIHPESILRQVDYLHPVFDLDSFKAQSRISEYSANHRSGPLYFCGSYFKFGFHEDAFASSVNLCENMLGRSPWS